MNTYREQHMRSIRASLLPPVAERAIQRLKEFYKRDSIGANHWTKDWIEKGAIEAKSLYYAFPWGNTKEGNTYWAEIYDGVVGHEYE